MVRSDGELDAPLPHTHTHTQSRDGPTGWLPGTGLVPAISAVGGREERCPQQPGQSRCPCLRCGSQPPQGAEECGGGRREAGRGPTSCSERSQNLQPLRSLQPPQNSAVQTASRPAQGPLSIPGVRFPPGFNFIFFFFFNDDDDDLNFIFFIRARSQPAPAEQSGATRGGLQLAPAARWLLAAGLLGVFKPCENPGSW